MRGSRRGPKQLRRATLYGEQDGLCFWCEEPMILLQKYPTHGGVAGNVCTLDHLRDRDNPTRHQPNYSNEIRTVAACSACNRERDQARIRVNLEARA